jgi:hypothetical protein
MTPQDFLPGLAHFREVLIGRIKPWNDVRVVRFCRHGKATDAFKRGA